MEDKRKNVGLGVALSRERSLSPGMKDEHALSMSPAAFTGEHIVVTGVHRLIS